MVLIREVEELRVRLLCDNSVRMGMRRIMAEHGFSALLKAEGGAVLFDAGQSGKVVISNIIATGEVSGIEKVVLSHGHYDHSGGLLEIKEAFPSITKVYAGRGAFFRRYKKVRGKTVEIGAPFTEEQVREKGVQIVECASPILVEDWIAATGKVTKTNEFERPETEFYIYANNSYAQDPFEDDQGVIIRLKGKGLVIITGCAHSGIANTVKQAKIMTGEEKVYAIIGGFHLNDASDRRMGKTIDALKEANPEVLIPCHCTGFSATNEIINAFGAKVWEAGSGALFTLGAKSF
ncbi:MAG: MBL fold metallo-hydrolase [Candidatus Methanomethylicia archaeon]|nr:MBL fold metallo-hydrolase [Candidatus Methanomethylicia archaeon]